jgi:iron complex outermembrane receptor protein
LGALLAAMFVIPTALLAQAPIALESDARLQGVVVLESTFEPIVDAIVSLVGTDIETRTGPLGQFAIADAPLGTNWIRITAPGLPSVREQIEVTEDGIVFLQFRMPTDVFAYLDDVLVEAWRPGEVATSEAQTALDLLQRKVPGISRNSSGDVGNHDQALRLRGFSSLTADGEPLVVLDDVVLRGAPALELLSQIPAGDVESIEILSGPTAAFRYPFASNGVIRVRTRKH